MAESSGDVLEAVLRQLQAGAILRLLSGMVQDDTDEEEEKEEDEEEEGDKNTLLHKFATRGNYFRVKALWDNGAKPTINKSESSTILHSAVTGSESEDEERAKILELFLQAKVPKIPINHQDSKGWTALKVATRRSLKKCVEVLLEHGADPDVADNEQYTPLHNAAGNPDMMRLLLTKVKDVNARNEEDETPLYCATERGEVDSALTLLDHGADPNIPNNEDIAPLFMAARDGKLELVKALVGKGAKINTLGAMQQIGALHWAAHKEHHEIVFFLIENGGDINLRDKEGRTPLSMASPFLALLMIAAAQRTNPLLTLSPSSSNLAQNPDQAAVACAEGKVEELEKMLQGGVPVDHVCSSGRHNWTLLHLAVFHGQAEVASLLMHRGADWKKTDDDGDTVLHLACMKENTALHDKVLEFLMTTPASSLKDAKNSNGDTPVMTATKAKSVSQVKIFLRFNVNVNIENKKKQVPLHVACIADKNIEIVLHLVEITSNINVQDKDGWTPLIFAAKTESPAIMKYLLLKGADTNLKVTEGFTALYLTASQNNPSMCLMLLEAGADPMIAGGRQDLTPLHIAAHLGSKDVCLLLVKHGADIHKEDVDGDTPLKLAKNDDLRREMQNVADKKMDYRASMADLQQGNYRALKRTDSMTVTSLPKKPLVEIDYSDLEFGACLGEGGFGAVFLGRWKSKGKVVAIKKVTGQLNPREVHIPNSLPVHPNVIQFYGAVLKMPNCCIVIEYAENGSLYDHLHKKRIKSGLEWSLSRAKEVARGMLFLHQNDVMHRDLKSCNILLSSNDTAKICDFGTARIAQQTTAMSKVTGTFGWMAPELLENPNSKVLSKACDVYSYGILLWELITREIPYASSGLSGIQIAMTVMKGNRPGIPATCPQYLADLMQVCWAIKPQERPGFNRIITVLVKKGF